ncbi:hypothetical protein ABZ784_36690 [Streptomyces tendae]|uniref:hypothetical protein n=1 Tax=Streptomyces tendae TaxID=1932 RepID=UPI0033C4150E
MTFIIKGRSSNGQRRTYPDAGTVAARPSVPGSDDPAGPQHPPGAPQGLVPRSDTKHRGEQK